MLISPFYFFTFTLYTISSVLLFAIVVVPAKISTIPINIPVATTGTIGSVKDKSPNTIFVIGLIKFFLSLVILRVNIRVDKPVMKSQIPKSIGISFIAPSVLVAKTIPKIKARIELPIEYEA